ncbi:hypothetical protein GCM10011497_06430 [Elstera cyanobacteriorum]|nr:sialidase family protein [Elstera cyanobacteriorum]GFZ80672.1 hypothetical protein GCM10011497_06430 [Elstera cyanobacteriorum]
MLIDFRTRTGGSGPPLPVWRTVNAPSWAYWQCIATNRAGRWVAIGTLPTNANYTVSAVSDDNGETWQYDGAGSLLPFAGGIHRLIFNAGLFIAVGVYGVATSPNGRTWTNQTASLPYAPSPANGYFAALAFGGFALMPYRTHSVHGVGAGPWYAKPLPVAENWAEMLGFGTGTVLLISQGGGNGSTVLRWQISPADYETMPSIPAPIWRGATGFSRSDGWPGWVFAFPQNQAAVFRSQWADSWDSLPLPRAIPLPVPTYGDGGLLVAGRSNACLRSADGAGFSDYSPVPDPYYVNDMAASGRRYIAVCYDRTGNSGATWQTDKFLILDVPA